jgi:APA family basic amino acid/polyamine antiporter
MRFTHKEVPRGFKIPLGPWVIPPVGALLCLLLMATSSKETGIRLVVWMAIGQVIYFSYGFWNSKLRLSRQIEPNVNNDNRSTHSDNQPTENEYVSEMDTFNHEKF